jgi:hypothetical protein
MSDACRGVIWRMSEAVRVDEIEPILQVARRRANLHILRGVAEEHTASAELVVDRQLLDAPGIHERYLGEVDERRSAGGQANVQGILDGTPVSDVELPGEIRIGTGRSPRCADPNLVASFFVTLPPSVLSQGHKPLPC